MIKKILKTIIIFLLRIEAKLILKKYNPKIIAISGTVGKTSTKDAIYCALFKKINVRKSEKSYNSEFGIPLTIIGAKSGWNNPILWFLNFLKGIKLLVAKKNYPEWLILETGVDRPKDMEKILSLIKPQIAVITALGEVPVHVEYFKETEELIKEKSKILRGLKMEDYAILNGDDNAVIELKENIKAKIISYGFGEDRYNLDFKASDYRVMCKKEDKKEIPEGISFKVNYKGNIVPLRLYNVFGKHTIYAALAAIAVGNILGLNLIEMSESLSQYQPPPGRLRLLRGIKNTFILDDSYNSSPLAVASALDLLKELPSKRKIAILGDMLELGKYTIEEHRKMGRKAKESADLLFFIGPRSKFAAEEARAVGFKEKDIFEFSTSDEAKKVVQEKIKKGDLILIKGSQSMRMERITEEIMVNPELKSELLVRQEKEWQNKN